jgi:uncharacterized protein (TIGR03086 family)
MHEAQAFISADQAFTRLVDQLSGSDWDISVPSTPDWTVRQLVAHVADNNLTLVDTLNGAQVDPVVDLLNTDPARLWYDTARQAEAAAGTEVDAGRQVQDQLVEDILALQVCDRSLHAWDLAGATGKPFEIDRSLAELCFEFLQKRADAARNAGAFGPAVTLPADASVSDQLLGLTGRTPRADS